MNIQGIVSVTAASFLFLQLIPENTTAQTVIASEECETVYQGMLIRGALQLEDWTAYHGTYRLYGRFHDPLGNQYEFEVFTNQPQGGVGGLWVNGMRHRETHIQVIIQQGGFVIRSEDGITAAYRCG
jgi:hypothetical protein